MKTANETVTVELKNGEPLLPFTVFLLCPRVARLVENTRAYGGRPRYYHPWHHNLGLAADEHGAAQCKDDPQGPGDGLARQHEHPRQHNSLHHPARQLAAGHAA